MKAARRFLLSLALVASRESRPARFESVEGRFSVQAPAALEPYDKDVDLGGGFRATAHAFVGMSDGVIYTALYMDCPRDKVDMSERALRSSGGQTVSVTHSEPVRLGPYSGREEEIHVRDAKTSIVIHQRWIYAGGRLYQLTAIHPPGQPLPPAARAFLDSLSVRP